MPTSFRKKANITTYAGDTGSWSGGNAFGGWAAPEICCATGSTPGIFDPLPRGLMLSCATFLLFSAPLSAKSLTLYVATNGNDRWSGRLEKPARDGKDGPLASLPTALEKTRAAVRIPGNRPIGVTILMRGGTYSVAGPVVLTPEDSGFRRRSSIDHRRVFRNEYPVLSGGRRITGWSKVEGKPGLWQTGLLKFAKANGIPSTVYQRSSQATGANAEQRLFPGRRAIVSRTIRFDSNTATATSGKRGRKRMLNSSPA